MEDDGGDQTLALFDLYWFQLFVLSNFTLPHPDPPPSPPPPPELDDAESNTSSTPPASLLLRRTLHRRSLSEEDISPSPTLHIRTPKLQTIFSGKESAGVEIEIESFDYSAAKRERRSDRRRRRRKRSGADDPSSKSLSELEFEELKGFMDLGFTFSEAEADPRLMEIVPGLQRLKAAAAAEEAAAAAAAADDVAVHRPYLSEAWEAAEEEEAPPIKILSVTEGDDLKNQLRFWAHAVASTVR